MSKISLPHCSHVSHCFPSYHFDGERSCVVNDDAVPEWFAGGDKPGVIRAFGLVEIVVFDRLEVKGSRVVEGMIGHGAAFGGGGRADVAAFEVRNLGESTKLAFEERAFGWGEILAEPEEDVVD